MEIPGDVFKPFIGLVNQTTMVPVGTLWAWKMSRMTMEFSPDKVDTPNNAFPDFATSIRAKRRCTGTISQASFDPAFNIYGFHPGGPVPPLAPPPVFNEGILIRMLCTPDTSILNPAGLAGERMGVPILPTAPAFPTVVAATDYVFLVIRISRIRHEADAAAGQPFDFEYESTSAFSLPGETGATLTTYGFSPTSGVGGFL